jgi:hypothetical protein
LLLCIVIKYAFPGKMRNTHSKIIAFMFVLQSLNMFKNKKESERTYGEFGFYLVLLLSIVQGGLHGFKLSSFKRSKHLLSNFIASENAVVEKVVNYQDV